MVLTLLGCYHHDNRLIIAGRDSLRLRQVAAEEMLELETKLREQWSGLDEFPDPPTFTREDAQARHRVTFVGDLSCIISGAPLNCPNLSIFEIVSFSTVTNCLTKSV